MILKIFTRRNYVPSKPIGNACHSCGSGSTRAIRVGRSKDITDIRQTVHIESAGGESAGGNHRLRVGSAAALAGTAFTRTALASGRYFRNHRISAVSCIHLRSQFRKRNREIIDTSGHQCLQTRDLIDRLMLVRSDGDGNFVTLYDAGNQGNISRVLFP